jgi:ATP diphosphatase
MSANIQQLLSIMKTLRDPENGCPWDLQQDFASIAPYTIEEAYEVADAIQRENLDDLKDELGDLLLQVVFHAQMAAEQEAFDFDDVALAICDKMTRRHPHVFAVDPNVENMVDSDVLRADWEAMKEAERAGQGSTGVLDGIPRGMAELQRAYKLQKRAASAGFDWNSVDQVVDKLHEETAEFEQALIEQDQQALEEELGDLLFTMVNMARKLKLDPARALRAANAKFERRFRGVEQLAGGKQTMLGMDLEDMEEIWQQLKKEESGHE